MLPIDKTYLTNVTKKYSVKNAKKYITIHQTGSPTITSTAKANAQWFVTNTGNTNSSIHFVVDDMAIYQCASLDDSCWHAGNYEGNTQSIGIEICDNWITDETKYLKAIDNAIDLVVYLLQGDLSNLTADNLVQHNHWTGKDCPHEIRSGLFGFTWDMFINKVKERMDDDMSNRLPNYFNAEFYLIANPDVAQAVKEGKMASAEYHYLNFGYVEKRKYCPELPLDYCEGAYLAKNPDVAKAVADGERLNGADHWLLFGWNEGRAYKQDEKVIDASKIKEEIEKVIDTYVK